MTRSAQTDRFVHDRLPPRAQWPELRHDLPELQFPDQVNLVARLLDGAMGGRYGSTGNAEVARTRDRIASRLNEDRFYASDAGRLGTSGDRLSLRF